jgi:hypothetical protein
VDAVIIVAAVLALCAYLRSLERFETRHRWAFVILLLALAGFALGICAAGGRIGALFGPRLRELEESSSP